jgi:hypothetical protein
MSIDHEYNLNEIKNNITELIMDNEIAENYISYGWEDKLLEYIENNNLKITNEKLKLEIIKETYILKIKELDIELKKIELQEVKRKYEKIKMKL